MYTTESKIANYLGVTIPIGEAECYISMVDKYIEQQTGRKFKADKTATARLYDGNNRQDLSIDDCVEVTKVEVGTSYFADSGDLFEEVNHYFLLPNNYASEGTPIKAVGLKNRIWVEGQANHRITAKWGYSVNVPDDIVFAATVLAAGMYYQNKGENTGPIKSEKIGNYSVSYSDEKGFSDANLSKQILDSYKKYEL